MILHGRGANGVESGPRPTSGYKNHYSRCSLPTSLLLFHVVVHTTASELTHTPLCFEVEVVVALMHGLMGFLGGLIPLNAI